MPFITSVRTLGYYINILELQGKFISIFTDSPRKPTVRYIFSGFFDNILNIVNIGF